MDSIETGKRILSHLQFFRNIEGMDFGYPFGVLIPGSSRDEKNANESAVRAFLETTELKKNTDYEFSGDTDHPKLSVKELAAIDRVLGKTAGQVKK